MAAAHDLAKVDQSADNAGHDVLMPRLSKSLEAATVVRWFVTPGQTLTEGDVLAEVAGGSVTMEVEAQAAGTVTELLVPAGSDLLAAGTPIARFVVQPAPAGDPSLAAERTPAEGVATARSTREILAPGESDEPCSEMTFADALRAGLAGAMRQDPDIFVIGESVTDFGRCSTVVKGLAEEFGSRRVVGTPITPHAVVGLAVGAAMAGLKPVVEVTAWALALQALDPIVSSAAKTRYRSGGKLAVPIVLRGRNGAWPGTGPMHSVNLAAWFAAVPGLKVVCPATPACAKGLMRAALDDPDPVLVLEGDALYESTGLVPEDENWHVPIGKARVARVGDALTIVTYGSAVAVAIEAATLLETSGVSVEVVDLRSLRPLDMSTLLASVRKTGRLLTLDDAAPACSIGAEIVAGVAAAAFSSLRAAPVRMEAADVPVPYAANLEALVLPAAEDVALKSLRLIGQGRV